ncbi:DUF1491 family protein [Sphingomonas sp.]|uniref:DUF1491 family protein n=1 Tax=Sphingomonas sp. TaxID=28214 RepID=UPI00286D04BF|nr:DUF1491 family protein [Sphingomonas sp.]
MSEARLAAEVEASALLRLVEQRGGFGAVLHKGDATRGALLLAISERGAAVTCLARELTMSGNYGWARVGPATADAGMLRNFLEKRRRGDPDEWQIELDVPSAERFIAETTDLG